MNTEFAGPLLAPINEFASQLKAVDPVCRPAGRVIEPAGRSNHPEWTSPLDVTSLT